MKHNALEINIKINKHMEWWMDIKQGTTQHRLIIIIAFRNKNKNRNRKTRLQQIKSHRKYNYNKIYIIVQLHNSIYKWSTDLIAIPWFIAIDALCDGFTLLSAMVETLVESVVFPHPKPTTLRECFQIPKLCIYMYAHNYN